MTSAWARAGFASRGEPCGSAVLVWRPTRLGGKGRGRQLTSRQGCVAEPQLEALARGWCSGRAENLTCFRTSPMTAVVVTLSFSVKQGHYWAGGGVLPAGGPLRKDLGPARADRERVDSP